MDTDSLLKEILSKLADLAADNRALHARLNALQSLSSTVLTVRNIVDHIARLRPQTRICSKEFLTEVFLNEYDIICCTEYVQSKRWENNDMLLTVHTRDEKYIFVEDEGNEVIYFNGLQLNIYDDDWKEQLESFIDDLPKISK